MSDVAPDDFSQQHPETHAGVAHTLGARLATEREAKGWTVEYVAGQLNLAVRQIQALEADNYTALPGLASVRGFVRAYAKLLRIDADSLVGLIVSEQVVPNQPLEPKPHLSSTPFSHSRLSGANGRGTSFKGAILALIVVLIAAAAIGIEHLGGWPTLSQSLSAQFKEMSGSGSASSASDDAASKPASDGANGQGEAGNSTPAPVTVVSPQPQLQVPPPVEASHAAPAAGTTVTDAPAPAGVQAPQAASAAALPKPDVPKPDAAKPDAAKPDAARSDIAAAKPASSAPAASGASGTLVLRARQNSWVDVRAGSNVVVSHLIKAGDTETFEVPGAAQLTIGNAAGVDATFRGQPLASKTDGKTNVAHISLK